MQDYQRAFIDFALKNGILKFGQFTLKSGRVSPYFFNAGQFKTGDALSDMGRFYAEALIASGQPFDVLFGPAYKGIPLVAATAISLHRDFQLNTPWVFNRKEAKDHGEGGQLVGAELGQQTVIIDDVITAGTAIREVIDLFKQVPGAHISAVLVALDRQERGQGALSAIQELEQEYGLPVISIISLTDLLAYIQTDATLAQYAEAIAQYRDTYGIQSQP